MMLVDWFRRAFKSESVRTSLDLFREVYGGRESIAGETVTAKSALEVATVLSCVRVLAEGVAQVPFRLHRDTNGRKETVLDHPVQQLLFRRPNTWQTSFEFFETIMFHLGLTWNAFVFVNRVGIEREVRELTIIEPHRVAVKQLADKSLEYKVTAESGAVQVFPQDSMWHIRGPSWNAYLGMPATQIARNAIGLSIGLERGQAEFQKNGVKASGLLAVKEQLGQEKYEFLAGWLDKHMPGGERAGKPIIADMDATFTPFAMSAVDQQLLETRKHQIEEICRAWRVMPIMVGHADKTATYASAEQMFLAHVVHTLMPWYRRIEVSADVNLLSEAEIADGFYTKFNPNALMRGAAKDRGEFYAKALGAGGGKGWMTQNDVRSLEDLDRMDDPLADKLAQPLGKAKNNRQTEPDDPDKEQDE